MGFYGNIFNNLSDSSFNLKNTQFQLDKFYSNRYLLDITASHDNIYNGRYVLIDYNKDLTSTLQRAIIGDNGKFYYYNPNYKELELKNLDEISSFVENDYIYVIEDYDLEQNIPSITNSCQFYQYTNNIFTSTNYLNECKNTFKIKNVKKTISIYDFNNYIDTQHQDENGKIKYAKTCDSTIWQKIFINGESTYTQIAELDAVNPRIDLLITPPKDHGLSNIPQMNVESDEKYKLFLSAQPGFRISDKPYLPIEPYRPNIYYYDDVNGQRILDNSPFYTPGRLYYKNENLIEIYDNYQPNTFFLNVNGKYVLDESDQGSLNKFTQYYLLISDEKTIHSKYDKNILRNVTTDGAIYYNKDGLNKHFRVIKNIPNSITMKQDGSSGYEYEQQEYYEYISINNSEEFQDIFYFKILDINEQNFQEKLNQYSKIYKKNLDTNLYEEVTEYLYNNIYYYYENNIYCHKNDNTGYLKVLDNETYDEDNEYYYKKIIQSGTKNDTNQLSIVLPAIGNMVAEGWDKIYGYEPNNERNLNEYEYNPQRNEYRYKTINKITTEELFNEYKNIYNKLYYYDSIEYKYIEALEFNNNISTYYYELKNPNLKFDNIIGLKNNYIKEIQRLKNYDANTSASFNDGLGESIPLIITEEVNSDGINVKRAQPLIKNNVIQNQIAINNLSIKQLADQIGLDYYNDIIYEEVPNITAESYQPGLYYYRINEEYIQDNSNFITEDRTYYIYINGVYEEMPNITAESYQPGLYYYKIGQYILDNSHSMTLGRVYYTSRIKKLFLTDTAGTIQEQININQNNIEDLTENFDNRFNDIENLASISGFIFNKGLQNTSSNISIDQNNKDHTLQGQINRNDADIEKIIEILGVNRDGEAYNNDVYIPLYNINESLFIKYKNIFKTLYYSTQTYNKVNIDSESFNNSKYYLFIRVSDSENNNFDPEENYYELYLDDIYIKSNISAEDFDSSKYFITRPANEYILGNSYYEESVIYTVAQSYQNNIDTYYYKILQENSIGLNINEKQPILNQITYNDYDIQKLSNRILRIEEFLKAGHFLFSFGRDPATKNYRCDGLQPIPGENKDEYIRVFTYIENVLYYTKTIDDNGVITYTPDNNVTIDNFNQNKYYIHWTYDENIPAINNYISFKDIN